MLSLHLAEIGPRAAVRALRSPPAPAQIGGLRYAECLTPTPMGGSLAPRPPQLGRIAVFASWHDEDDLDGFLTGNPFGQMLARGWHLRLEPLRVYGHWSPLPDLPTEERPADPEEAMAVVTIARTRHSQLPRFLRASNPAENQAIEDPASVLAVALIRLPRTVATFSIWRTLREMRAFALGRTGEAVSRRNRADAHINAIREQRRKDFHRESAFIRFRPLSEHGVWEGRQPLAEARAADRGPAS